MVRNIHPDIKPIKISDKLTAKVPQHFSYAVCVAGDDEKYYELKPNYHKDHPATVIFHQWWRVVRRMLPISDWLERRTRNTFGRAGIKPLGVRYFITFQYSKQIEGRDTLTRQRHLVGVRVSPYDFERLRSSNYLRDTSFSKKNLESSDLKPEHIYDFIPLLHYRERMMLKR